MDFFVRCKIEWFNLGDGWKLLDKPIFIHLLICQFSMTTFFVVGENVIP